MDERDRPPVVPPGWRLAGRSDTPTRSIVRFTRDGDGGHWLLATGATYDDALANGRERIALYEAIQNERRPRP